MKSKRMSSKKASQKSEICADILIIVAPADHMRIIFMLADGGHGVMRKHHGPLHDA